MIGLIVEHAVARETLDQLREDGIVLEQPPRLTATAAELLGKICYALLIRNEERVRRLARPGMTHAGHGVGIEAAIHCEQGSSGPVAGDTGPASTTARPFKKVRAVIVVVCLAAWRSIYPHREGYHMKVLMVITMIRACSGSGGAA
jgi:hypothetical protein